MPPSGSELGQQGELGRQPTLEDVSSEGANVRRDEEEHRVCKE